MQTTSCHSVLQIGPDSNLIRHTVGSAKTATDSAPRLSLDYSRGMAAFLTVPYNRPSDPQLHTTLLLIHLSPLRGGLPAHRTSRRDTVCSPLFDLPRSYNLDIRHADS